MSTASFDHLAVLLEILQATRNLATSMRFNATVHVGWLGGKLDGSSPSNPVLTDIAAAMDQCAASYLGIIAQATSFVGSNPSAVSAATALIGATTADLAAYAAPLKTAATALQAADKSTAANALAACNALLSAVPAPAVMFG